MAAKVKSVASKLRYILLVIICFPRFLTYMLKSRTIIAFDWYDASFGEFYDPLYNELVAGQERVPILFFFRHKLGDPRFPLIKQGLPYVYRNLLDNKIVIAANTIHYRSLKNTLRVLLFAGLFPEADPSEYITSFDVFFVPSRAIWERLQDHKDLIEGKKIIKVGYPKLDGLMVAETSNEKRIIKPALSRHAAPEEPITIFYATNYNSRYNGFLPAVVALCRKNGYRLVLRVDTNNGDNNGMQKIRRYLKDCPDLILLENDSNIAAWFDRTDILLTEGTGLGFEFVLATGKPIIFLGESLNMVQSRYPIGPVVNRPQDLEGTMQYVLHMDSFTEARLTFKEKFLFNAGKATPLAEFVLMSLYREQEKIRKEKEKDFAV